ncbi:hypothetical protein EN873_24375 [bacterium M00.F.Ca.ET.230.01.1.1]|nr:hypothetical protein EN873_24375 [bacterium M00.F.Ca.ET.230.01.1.1]
MFKFCLIALALTMFGVQPTFAQNTPCSGDKGGISNCQGRTFICNDGSVSASRKNCSVYTGGASDPLGLMDGSAEMAPTIERGECNCRDGHYCTGPRRGRFCIKDSGGKSYLSN